MIVCGICGKSFKNKGGLAGHMHGKHPGQVEPKHKPLTLKQEVKRLDKALVRLRQPVTLQQALQDLNVALASLNAQADKKLDKSRLEALKALEKRIEALEAKRSVRGTQ